MTKTKFTSSNIYIYIYILLILATSYKVTKNYFFDKTKTIIPKTWSINLTKKSLMTYQKLVFTVNRTHT